jgi:hypothetical protein
MTPKEKAQELIDKFTLPFSPNIEEAKQCSFIAVDELIKVACDYSDYDETVTKETWAEIRNKLKQLD